MTIEINNLTNFAVDKKVFSTVAKKVLKGENRETEAVSLAFVDKEEIRKVNKKFRKKNRATDVLSFLLNEKQCLGEIIICPEIIKENAKKYKIPIKEEMMKVFIHGILHLCGYDHEKSEKEAKIMENKQNIYLSKINF